MFAFNRVTARVLGLGVLVTGALLLSGCAGLDRITDQQPASRNTIYLGNSPITVPTSEHNANRYTCPGHAIVYCERFGTTTTCRCARIDTGFGW